MFTIPTEAVSQVVRDVATSQIIQSAIGTIIGIVVLSTVPVVVTAIADNTSSAWNYFRTPAKPVIDGTAKPAA